MPKVSVQINQWEPDLRHKLGTRLKCKFLGPTPDLLKQKLQSWGASVCVLASPLVDCDGAEAWEPLMELGS